MPTGQIITINGRRVSVTVPANNDNPPGEPPPNGFFAGNHNLDPSARDIQAAIPGARLEVVQEVNDPELPNIDRVPGGTYTYYRVDPQFSRDRGLLELPGMTDDEDIEVAFVRVSQPRLLLDIRWSCEREGEPPVIPDPESDDTNIVLLRDIYMPGHLETLSGGQKRFRCAGRYIYGFKKPSLARMIAAIPAWVRDIELAVGLVTGGLGAALVRVAAEAEAAEMLTTRSKRIVLTSDSQLAAVGSGGPQA